MAGVLLLKETNSANAGLPGRKRVLSPEGSPCWRSAGLASGPRKCSTDEQIKTLNICAKADEREGQRVMNEFYKWAIYRGTDHGFGKQEYLLVLGDSPL